MKVTNKLATTKYTEIYCEDEIRYNAPHHFTVNEVETGKMIESINFQKGPIKECGVNGIANEDAIVMVLTRLESFQNSEYACEENAKAIECLESALMWLRQRTNKRIERNVEGTSQI